MSVDYDLVCHRHKEKMLVCSDGFSGPLTQLTGTRTLAAFIITHRNCDLSVIDEHIEDYDDYTDWDEIDWQDLITYDYDKPPNINKEK